MSNRGRDRKLKATGQYKTIYLPSACCATAQGNIKEHILIAHRAVGKCIAGHPVHHFDYDCANNANTNLVICEDDAYHALLHLRQRVVEMGGDPNRDKICSNCLKVLPIESFQLNRSRFDGRHSRCKSCNQRQYIEDYICGCSDGPKPYSELAHRCIAHSSDLLVRYKVHQ